MTCTTEEEVIMHIVAMCKNSLADEMGLRKYPVNIWIMAVSKVWYGEGRKETAHLDFATRVFRELIDTAREIRLNKI